MYAEESLREELVKKLKQEQEEYLNEVREEGVEYALEKAYEITTRQEIIDYLSYANVDLKDMKALIKTEHIIDRIYDEWLGFDGNFYEILEYPIENEIKRISDDFYNKDDKEVGQNKKMLEKNKNRER